VSLRKNIIICWGTELVFLFCFSILSGNSLDQDNSLNTLMMLVSQMIVTFVIFDWHLSNFQILFLLLLNDYACMRELGGNA